MIDTAKLPLGQQYKIVIPATVKSDAAADKDIVNVARQLVVNSSGKQLAIKTETRVNKLSVPKATPKQKETQFKKLRIPSFLRQEKAKQHSAFHSLAQHCLVLRHFLNGVRL